MLELGQVHMAERLGGIVSFFAKKCRGFVELLFRFEKISDSNRRDRLEERRAAHFESETQSAGQIECPPRVIERAREGIHFEKELSEIDECQSQEVTIVERFEALSGGIQRVVSLGVFSAPKVDVPQVEIDERLDACFAGFHRQRAHEAIELLRMTETPQRRESGRPIQLNDAHHGLVAHLARRTKGSVISGQRPFGTLASMVDVAEIEIHARGRAPVAALEKHAPPALSDGNCFAIAAQVRQRVDLPDRNPSNLRSLPTRW